MKNRQVYDIARLALVFLPVLTGHTNGQDAFQQLTPSDPTQEMAPNAYLAPSAEKASNLHTVTFEARLTQDGQPIQKGLSWYVFSPIAGSDGKLPLIANAEGGNAQFQLPPGDYFVNVSFGRAAATKKLNVPTESDVTQVLTLDAGGLLLNAVSGSDNHIKPEKLSFSIYSSEVKPDGERALVMADVSPDKIIRLSAGTYHIVSEYGDINSVVRSDIQVEAGKLTEATIQHKAAQVTLKLVSEEGGEAIADTAWSVLTAAGDSVGESVSAFPSLVLVEGNYTAVAKNKDRIYQKDFVVSAGQNQEISVLMKDQTQNRDPLPTARLRGAPIQSSSSHAMSDAGASTIDLPLKDDSSSLD